MNKIYIILYAILKLNYFKLFTLYDSKSNNIVWVFKNFNLKSFLNNNYLNDLALINSFLDLNIPFKFKLGNDLTNIVNKKVFYNISKELNFVNLHDHNIVLYSIISGLEEQGNVCFPSSYELQFWENKKFMHKKFEESGVNSPQTFFSNYFNNTENLAYLNKFPYLIKESHSAGGAGIFSVKNLDEFLSITKILREKGIHDYLVQERVKMLRDLRIIIIGDEIVLHYWRINLSNEWKITSTKEGSQVDFNFLPKGIVEKMIFYTKALNLRAAAYDITYQNDDFETDPIVLEVSPAFMPNPKQRFGVGTISYDKYKNNLFRIPNYSIDYVNLVFDLKIKLLKTQFVNLQ